MRETNKNVERTGYDGVFKALGDEHRLQILKLLAKTELSAGEILESMDIVQSTLSHHMKVLTDSGVVTATRSGKWTIYSVNMEVLEDTERALADFLKEASAAGKSEIAENALRAKAEGGAERKAAPEIEHETAEAEPEDRPEEPEKREPEEEKVRFRQEPVPEKDGKEKKKGKKSKKSKKNGKK